MISGMNIFLVQLSRTKVIYELLWDMNIQCEYVIEARRPDLVIGNKVEKSAVIIDVVILGDKKNTRKRTRKD